MSQVGKPFRQSPAEGNPPAVLPHHDTGSSVSVGVEIQGVKLSSMPYLINEGMRELLIRQVRGVGSTKLTYINSFSDPTKTC
ncbi:hypothetical protein SAMD00079811_28460 [Scytonema sp. HK-05]|nr:hypothetical protein SAMD00079811_28460 [Scytonema sp. HK-05]